MVIQDYHLHTHFSGDSRSKMEAVCQRALACGLIEIAFAEHHDFETFGPDFNKLSVAEYRAEIERCRALYGERIHIRFGVEIGEPHLFPEEARRLLKMGDFDVVIGSLHYVGQLPTWNGRYFSEYSLEQGIIRYFDELARMVEAGDFDILGHFDVLSHAAHSTWGTAYLDYAPYADLVRHVLHLAVKRGKALEINTKALRRGMRAPNPPLQVLRWYRELGGELVTLGSDAHDVASVGAALESAAALAREAGFRHVTCYEKRQPKLLPIS